MSKDTFGRSAGQETIIDPLTQFIVIRLYLDAAASINPGIVPPVTNIDAITQDAYQPIPPNQTNKDRSHAIST